jgi:para-aminobenzoate synthetase component 1
MQWYWRLLPLESRTGSEVFAALFRREPTSTVATLLESPYPTPLDQTDLTRYSICAGAPRVVNGCPQVWTPPLGKVLPFLQQLFKRAEEQECRGAGAQAFCDNSLPFTGGWLGWLGYDIACEIERLPFLKSDPLPFPVAFWYEPECFAVLDHWEQILWLAASNPPQLDTLQNNLETALPLSPCPLVPLSSSSLPHLPTRIRNICTPCQKVYSGWGYFSG